MAAAPPPFALAPGLVTIGVMDFSTRNGKALYESAIKTIYPTDELFDGTAEKLSNFLYRVQIRADEYTGVLTGY